MYKVSMHNHTNLGDAQDTPEAMARTAYVQGFTHFAFTEHALNPGFPDITLTDEHIVPYMKAICDLKARYCNAMEVTLGIELDYFTNPDGRRGSWGLQVEALRGAFDFIIGSVHEIPFEDKYYSFNRAGEIDTLLNLSGRSAASVVTQYYETEMDMLETVQPEILGHMDLIKKCNERDRLYAEGSHRIRALKEKVVECAKKYDTIIEVNTGGISRYGAHAVYPTVEVLKMCRRKGVPVTIGADAHNTKDIYAHYELALSMLKEAGIREIAVFEGKKLKMLPLDEQKEMAV